MTVKEELKYYREPKNINDLTFNLLKKIQEYVDRRVSKEEVICYSKWMQNNLLTNAGLGNNPYFEKTDIMQRIERIFIKILKENGLM